MSLRNGFGRSRARVPSKASATLDLNWHRPSEFERSLILRIRGLLALPEMLETVDATKPDMVR